MAFATFAASVIEGEIRHHLRDQTAPVRIPRALEETRTKLLGRRSELESALGRPPTTEELAKALDMHESEIERALIAERARRSGFNLRPRKRVPRGRWRTAHFHPRPAAARRPACARLTTVSARSSSFASTPT